MGIDRWINRVMDIKESRGCYVTVPDIRDGASFSTRDGRTTYTVLGRGNGLYTVMVETFRHHQARNDVRGADLILDAKALAELWVVTHCGKLRPHKSLLAPTPPGVPR